MAYRAIWAGTLGLILSAGTAGADLAAGNNGVETVVVTGARAANADKSNTPLLETPQNIQVLSSELLLEQGALKLDDALRNVAGVMPGGYYQNYDYFRIRGFDASGYLYQDGLFDYGVDLNAELYGLEQVEVVKGPASSLYGQGSLGGLINLVSKHPVPGTFLTAGVSYGSYDSYEVHADGGMALDDSGDVLGRLVGLYRHTGSFTKYVEGDDRVYIAPSFTWQIDEATDLTILASYLHDDLNSSFPITYLGGVVPGPYGYYPLDTFTGEPGRSNTTMGERDAIGYEFRHRFDSIFSFAQNLRYTYNDTVWDRVLYTAYLIDDTAAKTLKVARYPYNYNAHWNEFAVDSRVMAEFSTGPVSHTLIAGVDHYSYDSRAHSAQIDYSDPNSYMILDLYHPVYGAPFPDMPNVSTVNQLIHDTGIYVQEHAKFGDFTATVGGRYDFAKAGDGWAGPFIAHKDTQFVPRVGLTYEILPQTVLYSSYSESFLPQSGKTAAGDFLKPEKGQQWEVGTKADLFDKRLGLTASLFQLTRQDVVTSDPTHPNFSVQTGEQQSRGAEIDARAALADGWQAILTYAYVDVKVTKDNTIPLGDHPLDIPPTSLGLWSRYVIQDGPMKGLGLAAGVYRYASEWGDLPNSFKLPAYTLVNTVISYDFGPFEGQFNIQNLLNQRYFSGSYSDTYVQPGSPRNYMVELNWKM